MHIIFFWCMCIYCQRCGKVSISTGLLLVQWLLVVSRQILYRLIEAVKVIQTECKLGMKTDSLRNQYGITAQLSGRNGYDVTRLVATEHVRNKYPLLESFSLLKSHAGISSSTKLHCLNLHLLQ